MSCEQSVRGVEGSYDLSVEGARESVVNWGERVVGLFENNREKQLAPRCINRERTQANINFIFVWCIKSPFLLMTRSSVII